MILLQVLILVYISTTGILFSRFFLNWTQTGAHITISLFTFFLFSIDDTEFDLRIRWRSLF